MNTTQSVKAPAKANASPTETTKPHGRLIQILNGVAVFLPQPLKQAYYRHILGWRIGRNVRIGYAYLDALDVEIEDNVSIGHFSYIRGVRRLRLGDGAHIGRKNKIYADSPPGRDFPCSFTMGARAVVYTNHYIDACGEVEIGSQVSIAGGGTYIWSHSRKLDIVDHLEPLVTRIGNGTCVGAGSILVGCDIPPRSMVGAGSVVTTRFEPEERRLLIAGNPATIRKRYNLYVDPAREVADAEDTPSAG